MRRVLLLLLIAGCEKNDPLFCEQNPGASGCPQVDGAGSNAIDAAIDTPTSTRMCYGVAPFDVCLDTPPMSAVTFPATFDTDSSMCSATQHWGTAGQASACFVVGTTVTVTNTKITGSRPLVIIASGDLTVTGLLDAASHVNPASTGPGVPASPCGTYTSPADATGAGGGAGASFAPPGGPGGGGGIGNNGNATAGVGYAPFLAVPPGTLRAGCNGQTGGASNQIGGLGGRGGGAVYLMSGSKITLGASAIINVSGAGAGTAGKSDGGGGGGSGGMLLLNAPTFAVASGAKLVANGGGGSSGGNGNGAGTGTPGNDPDPTNPTTPAGASIGTSGGGNGGTGFAGTTLADSGKAGGSSGGGGGGGGGGGYIQANKALTNIIASPDVNVP